MLFQVVVIFLPILNFFQISCKRGKVHCLRFGAAEISNKQDIPELQFLLNISFSFINTESILILIVSFH